MGVKRECRLKKTQPLLTRGYAEKDFAKLQEGVQQGLSTGLGNLIVRVKQLHKPSSKTIHWKERKSYG